MGYLRYPPYFARFRCTASACAHNCCLAGWEIDIDDDTLARYMQLGGACGERLRASIALPPDGSEECAHFILDGQGRCPFLNSRNLCDLYAQLGAQSLCQVCAEHPRYYDCFSGGTETGVGLCCEAAAALILQQTEEPVWTSEADDGFEPPDYTDAERSAEAELFRMREQLFQTLRDDAPQDARMDALYRAAADMQDAVSPFPPDKRTTPGWTDMFWREDTLRRLLAFFLTLEINQPDWRDLLRRAQAMLPALLRHRRDFLAFYRDRLYEYDRLAEYFLYRHFMGARWDGAVCGRVRFALISTGVIQLLGIQAWLTGGRLAPEQQIELCRRYSEEIEYDPDNVEQLAAYDL